MGLESALHFSKEVVFWPKLNSQLKDLIQKCEVCCSLHAKQPREPLQPHPLPERRWEVIGADLFSIETSTFLITVDYYSGDEKMYKKVPIFRCTTPSTGKRLKEFEVVVGTLYNVPTTTSNSFNLFPVDGVVHRNIGTFLYIFSSRFGQ